MFGSSKSEIYIFFHEGSRYEYEAPLSEFPISRSQSQGRREAMVTKHHDDLPIFVLFLLPYSPSPAPCSVHTTHGPRLAGYRRAYTTAPTVRNPSLSFVLPPLALVTRTQRGQQRENGGAIIIVAHLRQKLHWSRAGNPTVTPPESPPKES